jgi:O-acetyl-ADP-ribose deacetylase (regulator of RNase III)
MIKYVTGDLLGATQKVIMHGCNDFGVMGSGVAAQIRKKWSNVYELYALRYKVFGLRPGDVIPVATVDGKIIVNAITQRGFGRGPQRYVDYGAVRTCFEKVNLKVVDWEVDEVAMPMIGAGLGGGDWSIIEGIINETASSYTPVVYRYDTPSTAL